MWSIHDPKLGLTTKVVMPADGIISIDKPPGVHVLAYINDAPTEIHHVHVKAGDIVHFCLKGLTDTPKSVSFEYAGTTSHVDVPAAEIVTTGEHIYTPIIEKEEIMTPAETINLFANPGMGSGVGAGAGAGLGAGLLGGVLGGALLGNRGLLGGAAAVDNVGGIVTPALLASSLAQVTDTAQSTTILQTLGDIKASVPLAESQVQLALAGVQADINGNLSTANVMNAGNFATVNKNISDAIATSLASQAAIKETVLSSAAANLTATLNSKFELANAIRDDGDKTRALIVAQNDASLNRQLAVAESALLEQRAIGRARETEVNVTQTVNQNQAQLQAQAQQQQQFLITNNLLQAILSQAQVAQATNQSLIIGNTGAVAGGNQAANPTNVRA